MEYEGTLKRKYNELLRSYKKVRVERHEVKTELEGMLQMNSEINDEITSLREKLDQAQWNADDRGNRIRELKELLKKKEKKHRSEVCYMNRKVTDLKYENSYLKAKYERLCDHVLMKEAEFKKLVNNAKAKPKVESKVVYTSTKKEKKSRWLESVNIPSFA